jgi:hypothetical protein
MRIQWLTGSISVACIATFCLAWNFYFPTRAEKLIWRTACAYNAAFVLVGPAIAGYWSFIPAGQRHANAVDLEWQQNHAKRESWLFRLRNISSSKDPKLTVPLSYMVPVTIICAFYCIFRVLIFVEDVIGLRKVPVSAFETVVWSKYIPHL